MIVPRDRLAPLLSSGIVALALLAFPDTAAAHAQLVSSSPGSGELVPVAPAEARLVFSEPAEPRYTGADLLDAQGRVVGLGLGELDPAHPRQLVIRLPTLADGAYSVSWHAVSAADGHETNGFVTFAVGDTPLPPDVGAYDPGSSGDIHGGRSGGTALAETQGRAGSYLGLMLALGLALMGWLVVRPAVGSLPPGFVFSQAAALLVAGLASGLLALSGAEAFTSLWSDATGGGDTLGFLLASRTGLMLVSRTLVALGAAVVVFLLARPRPSWGLAVGFGGAGIGVALTAAGSHAAAFGSVAPILAQGVHMGAAGVWLAGLVVFAGGLATGALKRHDLGRLVPRFSALALVSVAILSLTGVYNAWLETGELLPLGTGYAGVLLVKVLLFLAAIVLGALNFLERPRAPGGAAPVRTARGGRGGVRPGGRRSDGAAGQWFSARRGAAGRDRARSCGRCHGRVRQCRVGSVWRRARHPACTPGPGSVHRAARGRATGRLCGRAAIAAARSRPGTLHAAPDARAGDGSALRDVRWLPRGGITMGCDSGGRRSGRHRARSAEILVRAGRDRYLGRQGDAAGGPGARGRPGAHRARRARAELRRRRWAVAADGTCDGAGLIAGRGRHSSDRGASHDSGWASAMTMPMLTPGLLFGLEAMVLAVVIWLLGPTIRDRWPALARLIRRVPLAVLLVGVGLVGLTLFGERTPDADRANPVARTVDSIAAGATLYQANCSRATALTREVADRSPPRPPSDRRRSSPGTCSATRRATSSIGSPTACQVGCRRGLHSSPRRTGGTS